MNHAIVNTAVQLAAERMLHSIMIGLVMALFAWALLRVLPRPSAATRFAVWFTALSATAVLSVLGTPHHFIILPAALSKPLLSIPGSWAGYFVLMWAALSLLGLLRVAAGWVEMRRLRQSCRAISQASAQWHEIATKACPWRTLSIVTSDRAQVPTAIGFIKPIVILPYVLLEQLTAEEILQVLLHELAHLRRWDDWTNAVQKLIKAVLFFHPAVWWMEEQISLEREMACDDAVVNATSSPRAYAKCLATLAERSCGRRTTALVQGAVNRVRQTALRVARILDAERAQGPARKSAFLVITAFACACIGIATQLPQFVGFANEAPTAIAENLSPTTAIAPSPAPPASEAIKPILATTRVPVKEKPIRSTPVIHRPQRPLLAVNRTDIEPPFIFPAKGEFDMRATFKTGVVIIYVNDPVFGPTPLMFQFAVWEFVPAHSSQGVIQRNI